MAVSTEAGVVLVEVKGAKVGGYEEISVGGEVVAKTSQSLDDAMHTVSAIAESVSDAIAHSVRPPSDIEVTFGLKFGATAGVVVAKGNAEANLQVKMTWNSPDRSTS